MRAALRAFARGGYFGTTMNHIADEAGVSQPRVSQVFDGKLAAYLAAHDLALSVVLDAFHSAPVDPDVPALDRIGPAFMALLHERPEVILIALHTVTDSSIEPRLATAARQTLETLSDLLINRFGATPAAAAEFLGTGFLAMVLAAAHVGPDDPDGLRAVAATLPGVLPPS